MPQLADLPYPVLDALPLGAHRLIALTDDALFERTGVRIAFTGREGGVSTGCYASLNCKDDIGDDLTAVAANRQRVLEAMGACAAPLVVPKQVHGTDLVWADGNERSAEADGVLVEVPGVAAMLNFADCLPVIIVSPSGRFAVVHAGWRGAVAHIAGKAARELARCDLASTSSFNAYLGPHIRSECFEVGAEVEARFREQFGDEVVPAPHHVSLASAVRADLTETGLRSERIVDAGLCTVCNADRFFSYRASGGTCGRHTACAVNLSSGVRAAGN